MNINIGIVDDHQLFSKSLGLMLASFQGFTVVMDAIHGADLQKKLRNIRTKPDILLIDVNMPVMGGAQTTKWIKEKFPSIKLVALSMNENDQSIIDMFKAGCCSYLFKGTSPGEFEIALNQIHTRGYYNSDYLQRNYSRLLAAREDNEPVIGEREIEFLNLACSDKTYRQIAEVMKVSERTVDSYRESLFQKLNVESRTGMALEAIRKGLVKI
jgi:DNA-binding NarL/FixJ family response regulator